MIRWSDIYDSALLDLREAGPEAVRRSAVTKLYYSLFHRMTEAGASLITGALPELRSQITRAFGHAQMARVCDAYRRPPQPNSRQPIDQLAPVRSQAIIRLSNEFLRLQAARQLSDYDLAASVTLDYALDMWQSADDAHEALELVTGSPDLTTFLAALLLHDKWTRRG